MRILVVNDDPVRSPPGAIAQPVGESSLPRRWLTGFTETEQLQSGTDYDILESTIEST